MSKSASCEVDSSRATFIPIPFRTAHGTFHSSRAASSSCQRATIIRRWRRRADVIKTRHRVDLDARICLVRSVSTIGQFYIAVEKTNDQRTLYFLAHNVFILLSHDCSLVWPTLYSAAILLSRGKYHKPTKIRLAVTIPACLRVIVQVKLISRRVFG
jgi:hypothetical protein